MNGSAVPGTPCADRHTEPGVRIEAFTTLDALLADGQALFGANPGVFSGPAWWRTVLRFGMAADATPCLLLCRIDGAPAALFPMQRKPDGRLEGLTTPYTCTYQPLLAPELDASAQRQVFTAFATFCRGSGTTRLDALAAEWPSLDTCLAGARGAGLRVIRFDHFGNWHAPVAGLDWQRYLADRPGALRETVRRRLRRAEREPGARLDIFSTADGLETGIAAYELVYARSWKEAEPFPAFSAAFMRAAAVEGWLRLGIFRIGAQPVAAQLWVVDRGVATVLKLAHDEAFKPLSPGTVLTAWMLQRLLDEEHVVEIDFGRGDDPYKQGWAGQRRQRIGLILANPLRPAGFLLLARHALGRARAAVARRA